MTTNARSIQYSLLVILALVLIGYFTTGVRTYKFQTDRSVYVVGSDRSNLIRTQIVISDKVNKIANSFYIVDKTSLSVVYRYKGIGRQNNWETTDKGYRMQHVALAIPPLLPKGEYELKSDFSYQTPKDIKIDKVKIMDLKVPTDPTGKELNKYASISPLYYKSDVKALRKNDE